MNPSTQTKAGEFACWLKHKGARVSVSGGASFHAPAEAGFADAGGEEMRAIIAEVRAGRPWRDVIDARFAAKKRWLRDVILSPRRQAFFPLLPLRLGRVLDVGCGWGQMTLPLAARGEQVVALEPGPHRLAFVEAAAAQEGVSANIAFIAADFLECEFENDFDAILSIGVLEWAGAFRATGSPLTDQREFLSRAHRQLAPGGVLVVGIENRLGAKYLLGCPDDHIGEPGIACLPAELAARRWRARTGNDLRSFTFADFELREMLSAAGFRQIELHGAFPDYKLPEVIVPLDADAGELNQRLRDGLLAREHNGFNGEPLSEEFHERLGAFYGDVAQQGCAQHFVPSFFVLAR